MVKVVKHTGITIYMVAQAMDSNCLLWLGRTKGSTTHLDHEEKEHQEAITGQKQTNFKASPGSSLSSDYLQMPHRLMMYSVKIIIR